MKRMKHILAFIFCVGLGLTLFASPFAHAAGEKLTVVDVAGYEKLIAKHKGKIVLVNFFATWCPPCREEIPGLVAIADSMPNDVVVIGLSADEDPRKLPKFIDSMNIKYHVALAHIDLLRLFKVNTIPHNLIYDKSGKIVANAAGFVTEEEVNRFIKMLLEEDANAKRDNS